MTSHYSCESRPRGRAARRPWAGGRRRRPWRRHVCSAATPAPPRPTRERILVVVELSGGNDGLNTVVPYGDDAYYRARPKLGIRADKLRKLDDHFRLPADHGRLRAAVQGRPARDRARRRLRPTLASRISPRWRTGTPERPTAAKPYGWLGRLADAMDPARPRQLSWSTSTSHQSLAVRARNHVPLVFDDPDKVHARRGRSTRRARSLTVGRRGKRAQPERRRFLFESPASASTPSCCARGLAAYRTPVDYGLVRFGLDGSRR